MMCDVCNPPLFHFVNGKCRPTFCWPLALAIVGFVITEILSSCCRQVRLRCRHTSQSFVTHIRAGQHSRCRGSQV